MGADRKPNRLARDLRRAGYTVTKHRGNNHYLVCDRDGARVCTFACSPSDWRWLKNTLAKIRRHERQKGDIQP